jgi:hypothetical protein
VRVNLFPCRTFTMLTTVMQTPTIVDAAGKTWVDRTRAGRKGSCTTAGYPRRQRARGSSPAVYAIRAEPRDDVTLGDAPVVTHDRQAMPTVGLLDKTGNSQPARTLPASPIRRKATGPVANPTRPSLPARFERKRQNGDADRITSAAEPVEPRTPKGNEDRAHGFEGSGDRGRRAREPERTAGFARRRPTAGPFSHGQRSRRSSRRTSGTPGYGSIEDCVGRPLGVNTTSTLPSATPARTVIQRSCSRGLKRIVAKPVHAVSI